MMSLRSSVAFCLFVLLTSSSESEVLKSDMEQHASRNQNANQTVESIDQMLEELAGLQARLEQYRAGKNKPSESLVRTKAAMAELQDMLEQLNTVKEEKEKMTQLDYVQLTEEVGSLKKAVEEYGELQPPAGRPPASSLVSVSSVQAQPVGRVVYELPKPTEAPTIEGVVRPLEDEDDGETSDEDGSTVEEEGDGADSDAGGVVPSKGLDVDTEMPYGELAPFGREDTARELTEASIRESDEMVDQLERAEVAEEKRAVFRALTRLRGAAITSFDGVANSQTGNIDEYSKVHQFRNNHPLNHLAQEESDVSTWAFPASLMAEAPSF